MRRAGSRFAFAAVSLMRAPPFAKHSVLHAGTAGRRASCKRKRVFTLRSSSRLYRDKYRVEQSLASAGCGVWFLAASLALQLS